MGLCVLVTCACGDIWVVLRVILCKCGACVHVVLGASVLRVLCRVGCVCMWCAAYSYVLLPVFCVTCVLACCVGCVCVLVDTSTEAQRYQL